MEKVTERRKRVLEKKAVRTNGDVAAKRALFLFEWEEKKDMRTRREKFSSRDRTDLT